MVECNDTVGDEYVGAGVPFARDDSFRIETAQWRTRQKYPGKNVTSTMAEEHAIRQRPAPSGVALNAGLQSIHCAAEE